MLDIMPQDNVAIDLSAVTGVLAVYAGNSIIEVSVLMQGGIRILVETAGGADSNAYARKWTSYVNAAKRGENVNVQAGLPDWLRAA